MPNHASIHIIGHLGKDPITEQKGEYTTCRFSVAVTRKRKDGDLTTWWNITAWRKDAEYVAKYLKKGDVALVVGEPYLDEWTDKDGNKRQTLKIEAQRVTSLTPRKIEPAVAKPAVDTNDDEPPF
jgi:single-strand DNA-binding protein